MRRSTGLGFVGVAWGNAHNLDGDDVNNVDVMNVVGELIARHDAVINGIENDEDGMRSWVKATLPDGVQVVCRVLRGTYLLVPDEKVGELYQYIVDGVVGAARAEQEEEEKKMKDLVKTMADIRDTLCAQEGVHNISVNSQGDVHVLLCTEDDVRKAAQELGTSVKYDRSWQRWITVYHGIKIYAYKVE